MSPPQAFACWIARHTRSGVIGMSRCAIPSGESASTTAFTTAGVAAIVPVSPAPFTPSGLTSVSVSVRSTSKEREELGLRQRVLGHARRQELAVVVVGCALPQRLRHALGDAAVNLPVDDHRVDHAPHGVSRDR